MTMELRQLPFYRLGETTYSRIATSAILSAQADDLHETNKSFVTPTINKLLHTTITTS